MTSPAMTSPAMTSPAPAAAASLSTVDHALYAQQKPLIESMLRLGRALNSSLDVMFYDVDAFRAALSARGKTISGAVSLAVRKDAGQASSRAEPFDLMAAAGSVIIVNPDSASLVEAVFTDMKAFLHHANGPDGEGLHTLAVTGVGSSALGSVAFAWDVSEALGEPVAAIVPGYGVADLVPQALGGWLGFEAYDAIQSATQAMLASFAPWLASIGKELALSTPDRARAASGAPVFQKGSAASDDVHAILKHARRITRLVGHSKGALAIENALRSLPEHRRDQSLEIFTFGCAISEQFARGRYFQSLGVFDGLGLMNSPAYPLLHPAAHIPESWRGTTHTTNTGYPLPMRVREIIREAKAGVLAASESSAARPS